MQEHPHSSLPKAVGELHELILHKISQRYEKVTPNEENT